jgi:hypothetical protein
LSKISHILKFSAAVDKMQRAIIAMVVIGIKFSLFAILISMLVKRWISRERDDYGRVKTPELDEEIEMGGLNGEDRGEREGEF